MFQPDREYYAYTSVPVRWISLKRHQRKQKMVSGSSPFTSALQSPWQKDVGTWNQPKQLNMTVGYTAILQDSKTAIQRPIALTGPHHDFIQPQGNKLTIEVGTATTTTYDTHDQLETWNPPHLPHNWHRRPSRNSTLYDAFNSSLHPKSIFGTSTESHDQIVKTRECMRAMSSVIIGEDQCWVEKSNGEVKKHWVLISLIVFDQWGTLSETWSTTLTGWWMMNGPSLNSGPIQVDTAWMHG